MKSMLIFTVSLLNGKIMWQFMVLLMTTTPSMMPISGCGGVRTNRDDGRLLFLLIRFLKRERRHA